MKLTKLYSRTEIGQIQEWEIEIIGNYYVTREGIQGGKISESKPTLCFGKNAGKKNTTTDEEQALKEATALHKSKIKRNGYFDDITEIDAEAFETPMLAHKVRDHADKVIFPCMLDRKYNGGRVNAMPGELVTRKNEPYKAIPHIFETLKPFFERHREAFIDGEGYNHDLRYKLNELMSILRTQKAEKITPMLLRKSEQIVKLYVYDGYGFECDGVQITKYTGCKERRDALKKVLADIPYVVVVDYFICNNWDEVNELYNSFILDGYEGAMVRNLDAYYQHKRTTDLLKMKPEDSAEGIIKSIQEGTGNSAGLAVTAQIEWNGKSFKAIFNGTQAMRASILKNEADWLEKKVTFNYNGLTGLGTPNYAKIDPDNCFKEQDEYQAIHQECTSLCIPKIH